MKALVAHVFSAAAATYSLILQASWANDWLKLMRLKSPKWWYFCNWNKNLKLLRTCVEQMLFVIMKYQAKAWRPELFVPMLFVHASTREFQFLGNEVRSMFAQLILHFYCTIFLFQFLIFFFYFMNFLSFLSFFWHFFYLFIIIFSFLSICICIQAHLWFICMKNDRAVLISIILAFLRRP